MNFGRKDNLVHICEVIFCQWNIRVDEKLKYLNEKDQLTLR